MPKSHSSLNEEQISYICRITKVSREELVKTIWMARVNLDQVIKYLKKKVSG